MTEGTMKRIGVSVINWVTWILLAAVSPLLIVGYLVFNISCIVLGSRDELHRFWINGKKFWWEVKT